MSAPAHAYGRPTAGLSSTGSTHQRPDRHGWAGLHGLGRFALAGGVAARIVCLAIVMVAVEAALPRAASAPVLGVSSAEAQCIDEAIQDELNARRRYRGVRERLFQKAGRFEVSVLGGVYAADLLSASYLVTGALSYHVTEELGLEASFGYSRAESELVRIIEQDRGISLIRIDAPVFLYQAHLLWTLAYGKLRWFGSEIGRFDIRLAIGGGITDNQTARGLTGSAGLGASFFIGEWFAIRVDVRDQILEQSILGESRIVNNLTATLGLSVFIPFEN